MMFIIHEVEALKGRKYEIVKICDVGVMNTAKINGSYWPETSGQDVPLMYSSFITKIRHQNPPPPQIWLCRDTYFVASVDGLQYVANGSPEGSQAV